MRFVEKLTSSEIVSKKLHYLNKTDRLEIRTILISEQKGYCAYSERYIKETDAVDIEHFDGRIKNTSNDDYFNWYGVLSTKTEIIAIFNLFFCTIISHFLQNNALHCPIKNTYYVTKFLR
jgi:hypothetical protein